MYNISYIYFKKLAFNVLAVTDVWAGYRALRSIVPSVRDPCPKCSEEKHHKGAGPRLVFLRSPSRPTSGDAVTDLLGDGRAYIIINFFSIHWF
jgi:hypothetical protein